MTSGARQLVFELPIREALGRDDFLVSDSNAAAVAAIDAWPDWPDAGLILVGPAGCGKSHLVEVWRHRSGAARLPCTVLDGDPNNLIGNATAIAVEDCGPSLDQTGLFHLLNAAERAGTHILMSSEAPPALWRIELADLESRLSRLPVVEIAAPDDQLLQAVMTKMFADRQLSVDASILHYVMVRMERSFEAARELVAALDRAAIESKRPVTRSLAARILSTTVNDAD